LVNVFPKENCLYLIGCLLSKVIAGASNEELSSRGKEIIAHWLRGESQLATWTEYLSSLTIHNLLFPNTAYTLPGFAEIDECFCAVLQQPFIEGAQADLRDIKELLTFNGFVNTKRQDNFNNEFGLVLEDMHDENVIATGGVIKKGENTFF